MMTTKTKTTETKTTKTATAKEAHRNSGSRSHLHHLLEEMESCKSEAEVERGMSRWMWVRTARTLGSARLVRGRQRGRLEGEARETGR